MGADQVNQDAVPVFHGSHEGPCKCPAWGPYDGPRVQPYPSAGDASQEAGVATSSGRPASLGKAWEPIFDWLAANGVDEWLPEHPQFVTRGRPGSGTLTYTAYVWDGPRGWDSSHIRRADEGGAVTELREVPLLQEPSEDVRELCHSRPTLVEHDPSWMDG